jgi:hypothetical protein
MKINTTLTKPQAKMLLEALCEYEVNEEDRCPDEWYRFKRGVFERLIDRFEWSVW